MIKTLAQLKREAANYTWQLYSYSHDNGKTEKAHPFKDFVRTVDKVASKEIYLSTPSGNSSSMPFGKAANWKFEKYLYNDTDVIVVVQVPESSVVMRYHLRPVKVKPAHVDHITLSEFWACDFCMVQRVDTETVIVRFDSALESGRPCGLARYATLKNVSGQRANDNGTLKVLGTAMVARKLFDWIGDDSEV